MLKIKKTRKMLNESKVINSFELGYAFFIEISGKIYIFVPNDTILIGKNSMIKLKGMIRDTMSVGKRVDSFKLKFSEKTLESYKNTTPVTKETYDEISKEDELYNKVNKPNLTFDDLKNIIIDMYGNWFIFIGTKEDLDVLRSEQSKITPTNNIQKPVSKETVSFNQALANVRDMVTRRNFDKEWAKNIKPLEKYSTEQLLMYYKAALKIFNCPQPKNIQDVLEIGIFKNFFLEYLNRKNGDVFASGNLSESFNFLNEDDNNQNSSGFSKFEQGWINAWKGFTKDYIAFKKQIFDAIKDLNDSVNALKKVVKEEFEYMNKTLGDKLDGMENRAIERHNKK